MAGIETDGTVRRAAPIIGYMLGWTDAEVREHVWAPNWSVSIINAQPQNPYFYELKGQALLESGKPAEAVAPLRHAIQLAPNPALMQIMLAQALIATRDRARVDEAVSILQTAVTREPESPDAYSHLAMAYGLKNDLARADLASAQAAFMRGDIKTAREIATRAKTRFPIGSPGWVKADDIASLKPPQSARRN